VLFIDPNVATGPLPTLKSIYTHDWLGVRSSIADDPDSRVYFKATGNIPLGGSPDPNPSRRSTLQRHVSHPSVLVQINQPVNPSAQNISPDRALNTSIRTTPMRSNPGLWVKVRVVTLVQNCTQNGALLRVDPTGILPQGRLVRVVLACSPTSSATATPEPDGRLLPAHREEPGTTRRA
jgi:hypothetical protein